MAPPLKGDRFTTARFVSSQIPAEAATWQARSAGPPLEDPRLPGNDESTRGR